MKRSSVFEGLSERRFETIQEEALDVVSKLKLSGFKLQP
jgi:hypothetical protein